MSSAYGGGSIDVRKTVRADNERDSRNIRADLLFAFNSRRLNADAGVNEQHIADARQSLSSSRFTWNGGDPALHDCSTIEDPMELKKWKASLVKHPTMLSTEMALQPISTLIELVYPNKNTAVYKSPEHLLDAGATASYQEAYAREWINVAQNVAQFIFEAIGKLRVWFRSDANNFRSFHDE